MNPHQIVEHPACGRGLEALAFLGRQCGLMLLEGGAHALCEGCIHEQADGHHPQQRHEAFRLFERERGGQKRWGLQEAQPTFRVGLACIAGSQLLRGEERIVACMGGEDATTVVVDAGLTGCAPHGQCPVELRHAWVRGRAVAGAPSLRRAWKRADGALDHAGGLPALRTGRQGLRRIGGTGQAGAAQVLEGCGVLRTVLQQRFGHRALRLRLARRGVDASPAVCDPTIARSHHVRARARRERSHGLGSSLGQDRRGCAESRWDTGAPLQTRLGELWQVRCTLEGTVGDAAWRARGALHLGPMVCHDLPAVVRVTTLPTAGLHQHGNTGVGCDQQVQPHLGEVRAPIPAGAAGEVQDVLLRLLGTVIPALAMETRTIERGARG